MVRRKKRQLYILKIRKNLVRCQGAMPVTTEKNWKRSKKISQQKRKIFLDGFGETVVLSAGASKGPATLVSREPGELATIYLEKDITVIGKLETAADAVINIPTVSRIHAKIRKREGAYYLADLNSRNGTSVNGQLLKTGEDYLLEVRMKLFCTGPLYFFEIT